MLLVVCFALGSLAAWVLTSKKAAPMLTEQTLSEAVKKWDQSGIKNYGMKISISGSQNQEYEVRVKEGEVTSLISGGEPAAERLEKYWDVKGMFRFLEEELVNAEQPAIVYGVSGDSKVYLDAQFDPELGYPVYFLRQVTGKDIDIEWRISQFIRY